MSSMFMTVEKRDIHVSCTKVGGECLQNINWLVL